MSYPRQDEMESGPENLNPYFRSTALFLLREADKSL